MAKTREYSDVIKAVYKEIERLFKTPKLWDKEDEKIIQLFSILKEAVFEQVHNVLAPQRTAQGEKELRDILAKYYSWHHIASKNIRPGSVKTLIV